MAILCAVASFTLAGMPLEHGLLGQRLVELGAEEANLAERVSSMDADVVGLERKLNEVVASERSNEQTRQVRSAAETNGRLFHLAYDVRGADASTWAALLRWDWEHIIEGRLGATNSAAWVRERGRPVVALRGLGAPDAPGTVAETMDLVDWLKDRGCYVVAIVPSGWRTGAGLRPNFLSAFARVDAVQVTNSESLREDVELATQLGLAVQVTMNERAPLISDELESAPDLQRSTSGAFLEPADRNRFAVEAR